MTQPEARLKRRTSILKRAVELKRDRLEGDEKKDAARRMVPVWAHLQGKCKEPTISSLARATGISRSFLSLFLANKRKSHDARETLETHLELTVGGMLDVLSVLEEI